MPPRRPSAIGAHAPVAGGLSRGALKYAATVGADCVQVFVSNPRGWAATPGDPRDDHAFREGCAAGHIPVFVHAPYLVNLGSPTAATRAKSVDALAHALGRAAEIGAAGVVVHGGSAVAGARRDEALAQVRELLLPLLDAVAEDGPRLLIEPTAGGGQALAARVEDLTEYFAVLDDHPRLGVCLDTCHAYAAGHDLAAPGGVRTVLGALVKAVGRGRLGLVHVNDSRDALGSSRDRHATLGEGSIGTDPLRELFVHPATRGVPLVVETPGGAEGHARDIALLRRLRDS
jgi:deoxyribonuclease-4